jgi:DNA-binding transcriptional MerR regulator
MALKVSGRKREATNGTQRSRGSHKHAAITVPDKLYFRIGEVAELCDLPAYVLRFWETEFPQLKPVKGTSGQRMYRKRDVETVARIKDLLYNQGFTIAGARQALRDEAKSPRSQQALPFPVVYQKTTDLRPIRKGLQDILSILAK